MRLSRLVPAVAAGALFAATVGPAAGAAPAPTGVGSTAGTLTVLGLDAGGLLSLDLLADRGDANTNPAIGQPSAAAELAALVVESAAAGVSQTVPVVSTSSTGEKSTASQALTPIDNPVVSGSLLPIDLSALVGADGAVSELSGGLADLDILSGILAVSGTTLDLSSNAAPTNANGARGLSVDAVTVLDLESLLSGLGIPLTSLPLDTVLDLVNGLGLLGELNTAFETLGLPALAPEDLSVEAIGALIDEAGALETAAAVIDEGGDGVCESEASTVITTVGTTLGLPAETSCDAIATEVETLIESIPAVSTLLGDTLEAVLDVLDGAALLSVDGITVSVVTKATDQVATSVADVTAALEGLQVGPLAIPSVDLTATVAQLTAVLDQIESTLGGILGGIDPSLADLIDIGLFEEETSVTQSSGATVADAAFTALRVDVLPNVAELQSLITDLAQLESIGDLLADAGIDLPAGPLDELTALLDGVPTAGLIPVLGGVLPLSEGVGVRVASLSQRSTFAPVASTATPVPALPNTGSNDGMMLLFGAVAVVGALGARRWMRTER